MSIVDTVKTICIAAARDIPDATVLAPLGVWDGNGKSMGVQIKAPKMMGPQLCEIVAGFVLTQDDLKSQALIHKKASIAVMAMAAEVQMQIRPMRAEKVA